MSKPWGGAGAGAWALDAERAEAEELEQAAVAIAIAGETPQSFPSLKEAASTKPKKKKAVSMSLSQFTTGAYPVQGGGGGRSSEPKGLTPAEMARLPTGPRERSAEELEQRGLGGGFRSYGYGGGGQGGGARGGFPDRRSDEGDAPWGGGGRRPYGGGFEEEQRRGPAGARDSDLDQPSRADEVDNWATTKKSFAPSPMESGRHDRDRYSSLGSGSSSRADEMDNWSVGKKPLTSRYPSFGTGFRDSPGASDSDRWVRGGGGAPPPNNEDRERRRLVLDPPKGIASAPTEMSGTHPSPFGAARPREEVLAEKGLDWRKFDSEIEFKKTSRPTSSHSSRPSSAQSSRPGSPGSSQAAGAEGAPQARQKVNPFGDAKPREVMLQERGKDWRKIDSELDHRRVDRAETEEEKLLKEEINHLKKVLTDETETKVDDHSEQISAEEVAGLREQILERENQLGVLIREFDDKVRFGQKAVGDTRPGSGAGRMGMSSDRPPSQHGISDDSRSREFMERPRSRGGIGDGWAKPMDDRRGFHGGRESSFFGSRDMERSRSRERW